MKSHTSPPKTGDCGKEGVLLRTITSALKGPEHAKKGIKSMRETKNNGGGREERLWKRVVGKRGGAAGRALKPSARVHSMVCGR